MWRFLVNFLELSVAGGEDGWRVIGHNTMEKLYQEHFNQKLYTLMTEIFSRYKNL